jgi:hypothetical protein
VESANLVSPNVNETPWIHWLKVNDGAPCPTGAPPPPFIIKVFKHTSFGNPSPTPPACAATLCCALEECGFRSPHSARAADFIHYGIDVTGRDLIGSIIVIRHASGAHHVTTFDGWVDKSKGLMRARGGNQNHRVCVAVYNVSGNKHGHDEIVAWRWAVAA